MQHSDPRGLHLVRSTRARTLALIDGLWQGELDYSPSPGVWSVGEALDHLILSDTVYYSEIRQLFELKQAGKRPYLQRSFSDIDASILFIPKRLLPLVETPFNIMNIFLPRAVRNFFITTRLIPAQAPDLARPRPGRPGDALRRELQASPDELEELFAGQPEINYQEFVHYHPLLGENNLLELLQFLTNHEVVHQQQIQELLKKAQQRKRHGAASPR